MALAGKVAIVTGGNKGLGFAVVEGLCKRYEGTIYLTARNKQLGLEAVEKLARLNLRAEFHILDICSRESVKSFADFLKETHGGFDVLVNNAALFEWHEVYPSYEAAKRNIDTNYKSLLTIEEFLFPLLRKDARVVNISSSCGHLSNLKNPKWIEMLKSNDLSVEQLNIFVNEYLDSVKNGTFDPEDFADEGKHAEHRVAKIAMTALTMIWHRKYGRKGISINAVHPGFMNTDMALGRGDTDPKKAAEVVLYLILEASPNVKGTFMWSDRKLVDWYNHEGDYYCKGLW